MDSFSVSGSDSESLMMLVRNVSEAKAVREQLLSGQLPGSPGLALIKAELIPDPRLVRVAATKAQLAQKRGKMVTRQMATEVIFNLR